MLTVILFILVEEGWNLRAFSSKVALRFAWTTSCLDKDQVCSWTVSLVPCHCTVSTCFRCVLISAALQYRSWSSALFTAHSMCPYLNKNRTPVPVHFRCEWTVAITVCADYFLWYFHLRKSCACSYWQIALVLSGMDGNIVSLFRQFGKGGSARNQLWANIARKKNRCVLNTTH